MDKSKRKSAVVRAAAGYSVFYSYWDDELDAYVINDSCPEWEHGLPYDVAISKAREWAGDNIDELTACSD